MENIWLKEGIENVGNYARSFIICTLHQVMLGLCEMCIKFWSNNLQRRDHLGNLGVDGETILKGIVKN
jgi:hypothetical protein